MRTIEWDDGVVKMIDQRRLPQEYVVVEFHDYREVARAIKEMYIRGAPAIGAAAAFGLVLGARQSQAANREQLLADLEKAASVLRETRPTATNLFWAIERMLDRARRTEYHEVEKIVNALAAEAGNPLSLNMVMLGALTGSGSIPIGAEHIKKTISTSTKRAFLESNLKAFDLGLDSAKMMA